MATGIFMDTAALAGAIIIGVPLYVLAWAALRKQPRAIFLFAIALLAVGIGYLSAVGATADIARRILPGQFPAPAAVKA
jgi:dipeptide/tripeptide permease